MSETESLPHCDEEISESLPNVMSVSAGQPAKSDIADSSNPTPSRTDALGTAPLGPLLLGLCLPTAIAFSISAVGTVGSVGQLREGLFTLLRTALTSSGLLSRLGPPSTASTHRASHSQEWSGPGDAAAAHAYVVVSCLSPLPLRLALVLALTLDIGVGAVTLLYREALVAASISHAQPAHTHTPSPPTQLVLCLDPCCPKLVPVVHGTVYLPLAVAGQDMFPSPSATASVTADSSSAGGSAGSLSLGCLSPPDTDSVATGTTGTDAPSPDASVCASSALWTGGHHLVTPAPTSPPPSLAEWGARVSQGVVDALDACAVGLPITARSTAPLPVLCMGPCSTEAHAAVQRVLMGEGAGIRRRPQPVDTVDAVDTVDSTPGGDPSDPAPLPPPHAAPVHPYIYRPAYAVRCLDEGAGWVCAALYARACALRHQAIGTLPQGWEGPPSDRRRPHSHVQYRTHAQTSHDDQRPTREREGRIQRGQVVEYERVGRLRALYDLVRSEGERLPVP
ncbi:hypothetical protein KIPB_001991 [Kipferlia bialata]|uniref:Uncharacterized protein n=1 Tax=Kipferlia bialata TaxID=797122 RepID=A0A9K3GFK9_9EUKA|nr:hypothetical protein KIPB_001991 [Kipferlia bialata]|eukprot:g1991.t1